MAQELSQEQLLKQSQSLTSQQILAIHLLELPGSEFEERVRTEILDNNALEESSPGPDEEGYLDSAEQAHSEADRIMDDYRSEEDVPDGMPRMMNSSPNERAAEIPTGQDTSFFEMLREQISEHNLSDHERDLVDYLIGSLEDNGYLTKDFPSMEDDLAIRQNIFTTTSELESALRVLQSFEPAGIAARSSQECLMLQLQRQKSSAAHDLAVRIIERFYDEFLKHHWERLPQKLEVSAEEFQAAVWHIRRLNPKPGSSLGESVNSLGTVITPDFYVTVDDNGVNVELRSGNLPELRVSDSYRQTLNDYEHNKDKMSLQLKSDVVYIRQKVASARGFIEAVRQRQSTLLSMMRAIIRIQKDFFERYDDENALKPMRLKDVADIVKCDLSTVSRARSSKYVQTEYGIYPLHYFFSDCYVTEDGREISSREIERELKSIVDGEDKKSPLSDESLADMMAEKGYPIARRTIAKYRERMKIPKSTLRKE